MQEAQRKNNARNSEADLIPLPIIWDGITLGTVAEVVHDEVNLQEVEFAECHNFKCSHNIPRFLSIKPSCITYCLRLPLSFLCYIQYPNEHQSNNISRLISSGGGIPVDNNVIPRRSEYQFLCGPVMLADINTWATWVVGHHNFAAKYLVGRCHPEVIVTVIYISSLAKIIKSL